MNTLVCALKGGTHLKVVSTVYELFVHQAVGPASSPESYVEVLPIESLLSRYGTEESRLLCLYSGVSWNIIG